MKMAGLHHASDDSVIYFNAEKVMAVARDSLSSGTMLYLEGGTDFEVKETPEQVLELLSSLLS